MKKPSGPARQERNILAVSAAHYIHDVYSAFFAPLLPLLMEKLGMGYGLAAMLSFAQRMPSLINPAMGLLADRFSLRWLMVAAPALTGISMSFLGLAPNAAVVFGLLILMGIGSSAFHVPAPRWITDRAGMGMNWFVLSGELARMSGPVVIVAAVSAWSLEGSWRLAFAGIAASLVLMATSPEPKPQDVKTGSGAVADRTLADFWRQHAALLSGMLGYVFFRSLLKSALTAFLPVYMMRQGASLWMGGLALSVLQMGGAAGVMLAGPWRRRLNDRHVLAWTMLLAMPLMALFVNVSGLTGMACLFILGVLLLASEPLLLGLANQTPTKHPGLLNGMYLSIRLFGAGIAVICIGFLGDAFGLEQVFRWLPLMSLPALLFVAFFPKSGDKRPAAPNGERE